MVKEPLAASVPKADEVRCAGGGKVEVGASQISVTMRDTLRSGSLLSAAARRAAFVAS